ncbi:MAG: glycosyltransferase family 4 protein [Acidobacteriia bacterium]|nr:glycosyltransferase family 4 protein [Terriglobia bacterium]
MRILHIDTGREMRGGQWQVMHLLRGLRERGHQCCLLAREGAPLAALAAGEGFTVKPAGIFSVRSACSRFDLTHAHDGRGHTLAALAGARPLLVARRVAFPIKKGFASRWKYGRAVRFLAVSQYVKKEMMAAGIGEKRISVVYDGVPALTPQPAGERILAPATDDPGKGSALAREAAALAGVSIEFSSNLPADLPGCKLFLYLTHEEGLGSGALLAMSAGVPVIASAVGGLNEVIEDGVSGLLVGNRATTIAVRMRRLLEDPDLAALLATQGRLRVLERFSVQAMVDDTVRVYKECAA